KKAQILSLMRQFSLALEAIEKAESLEPSDSDILLIKASIYASQGMFDTSEELFNQALENAENKAEIYHQLATIYQMQANFSKAKDFLKKSLKISVDNPDALLELNFCYDVLDEKERSEEHTSELQSRENLVCRLLLE